MGTGPYTEEYPGLAAGPMGNWLAAVGLLRMLSRADPDAALHWHDGIPRVDSSTWEVVRVLADTVPFTPAITPWQSGGGWGEKDKTPLERIRKLAGSRSQLLAPMREAIAAADKVMARMRDSLTDDKAAVVQELRNWLPVDALPWLDVCAPLRSKDGDPKLSVAHSPIAGTGGNDARWDISTNYHAALIDIGADVDFDPAMSQRDFDQVVMRRRGLLTDLLAGTEEYPLMKASAGPYWGDATQAGLVNPWALILLVEGLCAFGDSRGGLQVFGDRRAPWTSAPGPEMAEGESPGECWLPMWGGPVTMPEIAVILGEQPSWRGRPAQTAANMYASLRSVGWPRGIDGYARYGLAKRRGHGHVAVQLDMVTPENQDTMDVLLTAEEVVQGLRATGIDIEIGTWRAYVSRGRAPAPDIRDQRTGRPQWFMSTIGGWLETRPGQGTRTDL